MKYSFKGKSYTTLSSCYEENKLLITVGIATIRYRLREGWTLDDALLTPKQKTLETKLGSHIVEGIEYPNLPSIAEKYGISSNTIYKRYSRGCRNDDLIPKEKRFDYIAPIREEKFNFFAGGVGYRNAADACRKLGVKLVTYRKRLENGCSTEEALGISDMIDGRSKRGEKYELFGEDYSIEELSENYKVPSTTIRDRLKRGATISQAVGLEPINQGSLLLKRQTSKTKRQPINLTVNGKTYNSYKALADDYGLKDYVVRQRITVYGYTAEEAVTINGKGKAVSVRGKNYKSLAEAATAHAITLEILLSRLGQGRTIEEALGLVSYMTSSSIEYNGKFYKSLSDVAIDVGISAGALRSRTKKGMSVADAIALGERVINTGRYNATILSRDPDLASKPALVYFVEIEIDGERRHKIGITTQKIEDRLAPEGYDYSVIKFGEGMLIECFNLEQELLELVADKRDRTVTSTMLDGYSEIIRLSPKDIEVVCNLIEEWQAEKSISKSLMSGAIVSQ
jgi:predicted DNA-binding protein YlxM (UPF0122 family)/DNA-binding Lrp family transcriptional regulator